MWGSLSETSTIGSNSSVSPEWKKARIPEVHLMNTINDNEPRIDHHTICKVALEMRYSIQKEDGKPSSGRELLGSGRLSLI
jgi:hypothetical protein